jgi:hypothetical protein
MLQQDAFVDQLLQQMRTLLQIGRFALKRTQGIHAGFYGPIGFVQDDRLHTAAHLVDVATGTDCVS